MYYYFTLRESERVSALTSPVSLLWSLLLVVLMNEQWVLDGILLAHVVSGCCVVDASGYVHENASLHMQLHVFGRYIPPTSHTSSSGFQCLS